MLDQTPQNLGDLVTVSGLEDQWFYWASGLKVKFAENWSLVSFTNLVCAFRRFRSAASHTVAPIRREEQKGGDLKVTDQPIRPELRS